MRIYRRAILVTTSFDMLRDVGHAYAQKLAKDGNDITYVHYPESPHGFILMTAHSKLCMEATLELACRLGEGLKSEAVPSDRPWKRAG